MSPSDRLHKHFQLGGSSKLRSARTLVSRRYFFLKSFTLTRIFESTTPYSCYVQTCHGTSLLGTEFVFLDSPHDWLLPLLIVAVN